MERFLAKSKQTGEVIIGMWEDVCDLDNRTWNVSVFDPEPVDIPLATIQIKKSSYSFNIYSKEIWKPNDLEGLYL